MNRISIRFLAPAAVALALMASPAARAGEVLAQGAFKGASGHSTSGTASVVKTADGTMLVLEPDFSFDGAPDPKVGFGKGGMYDINSQLAPLKSRKGEQSYEVPASLDLSAYDEVYIWCQRYSVPLGVARLK